MRTTNSILAAHVAPRRSPSVWQLVGFTGLVWGIGGLMSKGLIDDGVDSFMITALPFALGAIVAWVIAIRLGDTRREAVMPGLAFGAVNSALPALLFNIGYESLPAGIVTLLISLSPVFVAVAAHHAFSDEQFNARKGLGLALAVAGVATLAIAPDTLEGGSIWAAATVVAGAFIAGLTGVSARRLAVQHGSRALIAPQLTAAAITPFVLALVLSRPLSPTGGYTATHIAGMAAIGVVGAYGGFWSIMRANQIGTTGQVSIVGYIIPVVGVLGGVLVFGESLRAGTIIGGLLILTAVTLIGRASARRVPVRVTANANA